MKSKGETSGRVTTAADTNLGRTVSRRDALELIGKTSVMALLAAAYPVESPSVVGNPERPNIIYMHSHDTGRYVEPYGYNVSTPRLQRFANEGMVFRQAFSASPTCSPSRAALLTGMTPGCNGMWGLAHLGSSLNDYSQTFVQLLKRAGYTNTLVGIQHIFAGSTRACAAHIGFDKIIPTPTWAARHVADAAVNFFHRSLRHRSPRQPFFLDVGFIEAHVFEPTAKGSYFGCENGDPATAELPQNLPDTPETRRDMADYAVAAGVLDEAMGRVLDALEESGLADNTLVIVTTDHGIPLPGMKANHTDGGLGVMLMLRGPQGFSGGHVSNALVSQLDVFPTLCEVLGVPAPAWLQGRSLMPLVRGEAQINDAVFAEHETHRVPEPQASVRTLHYKYIRRLDGYDRPRSANTDTTYTLERWLREGWDDHLVAPEQLYDLSRDPAEKTNLSDDPAYADILADMRGRLVARMERYDNPLLRKYGVSLAPPAGLETFQPHVSPASGAASKLGVVYTDKTPHR